MFKYLWLTLLFSLFLFGCCGYSTRLSLIRSDIKKVAIPLAENKTLKIGLEDLLTNTLIETYRKDKRLDVSSLEEADIIIYCQITNFNKTPFSYDANQNITTWKITLDCSARCEERVKGTDLWEGNFSVFGTYDQNLETEEIGINRAIEKLCQDILRKTFSQW
ncbi:MAG: LPS assembly lipoprotein LptE [candidate division WOR-3 bacterium]